MQTTTPVTPESQIRELLQPAVDAAKAAGGDLGDYSAIFVTAYPSGELVFRALAGSDHLHSTTSFDDLMKIITKHNPFETRRAELLRKRDEIDAELSRLP